MKLNKVLYEKHILIHKTAILNISPSILYIVSFDNTNLLPRHPLRLGLVLYYYLVILLLSLINPNPYPVDLSSTHKEGGACPSPVGKICSTHRFKVWVQKWQNWAMGINELRKI